MIVAHAIRLSPEVLKRIASIDEFKGAWRTLGTQAPDQLSALRRVAAMGSIGSSTRIEGSKTLATRDEQAVAGYAQGMERVLSSWQDIAQIVEFAREHGRIAMGDAIRLTDGKRNTLKQHFRVLVGRGHLAQHGAGRVSGTSSRRHPMCHAAAAKKNKGALQVPMLRECAWYAKRIYLKKPLPFIIENGSSNIFNNSS
ncbi:filamentation induced by cAMP protein Fic [Verminephrobacter aporrectodeae]|uniref:filamentation induced by cAMP protein Fic n=1 Tax=Verminephrobacter aporrectodeae TaxID=1110389 RepID=UPI0002376506|nr:filamentation induced by cAMP protein Fic [Verminephrobacter aporrectodeae]